MGNGMNYEYDREIGYEGPEPWGGKAVCEERGGWEYAPDSVVAKVPESARSAQNTTVTTRAALVSFEQLAVCSTSNETYDRWSP